MMTKNNQRIVSHSLPGPWKTMDPIDGNQEEITDSIVNGTTHELFRRWRDEYGPVFVFYERSPVTDKLQARLIIGDPEIAKKLIPLFGQKIPDYKHIHVLGPSGILSTSDHKLWEKQRKSLSKVLSHKAVLSRSDHIAHDLNQFIESPLIKDAVQNNRPIDLYPQIVNMTFRMLVHSAFGNDIEVSDQEIEELRQAIDDCVIKGILHIDHDDPEHKISIDIVDRFILKIRQYADPDPNSIYGVITFRDADGNEIFSKIEQNNLITTFLFAGHETTAKTIYWTLLELARHPEIQNKLSDEIVKFSVQDKQHIIKNLVNFKYLTSVIHESMRLWPVVAGGTFRHVSHKMQILGDTFEENDVVCFSIDLPQSDKSWRCPHMFDPEREKNTTHFYPFSLAPRDCLGKNMAMMEIRMVIFRFFELFDVQMDDPLTQISGHYVGTMQPRGQIYLKIKKRQHSNKAKL